MPRPIRIGLDFDNTIAGYDHVFLLAARRAGLVPPGFAGGKREVSALIRSCPGGAEDWMRLQGQVYGRLMPAAELMPGLADFLVQARDSGIEIFVVSHKTETGHFDEQRIELRTVALDWMRAHRFFDADGFGLQEARISFHATREEKLERICELELDAFVDDLDVVLTHPNFPPRTRALLFDPDRTATGWPVISAEVLGTAALGSRHDVNVLAARLCQVRPTSITQLATGRNNSVHRVETTEGNYCLKTSLASPTDARDRFGAERAALMFLDAQDVEQSPRLLASHAPSNALLIEWVDGASIAEIHDSDLDQALEFTARLERLSHGTAAEGLPEASEACPSAAELVRQIDARLERLSAVACIDDQLSGFLHDELMPLFDAQLDRLQGVYRGLGLALDASLPRPYRTLSPSDFGFHNALRRDNGRVVFVDFEYFGWDDPVKLVSDFLLHPGMELSPAHKERFRAAACEIFEADPGFGARLDALQPLYAIRWCTILLNPFLPERRARLAFADAKLGQRALSRRLRKARRMAQSINQETHDDADRAA